MKTNETGRSMVEMLGVLAIIGVLSVAGIAGYTAAMRKNKVNNIVSDLSMCAILARTANGGEGYTSTTDTTCGDLGFSNPKSMLTSATGVHYVSEGVYALTPVIDGDDANGTYLTAVKTVTPVSTSTDTVKKRAGYYVSG